jgi:hypothetical protein
MYLLDLSLGSIPFKSPLVQRHIDPTAGTRVGNPVLVAYQAHSAIPAGSPTHQIGDPLASASSSGRGRSCKGPNLASKADADM